METAQGLGDVTNSPTMLWTFKIDGSTLNVNKVKLKDKMDASSLCLEMDDRAFFRVRVEKLICS